MKIAVAGTGYVGLVTGVAMAHIGHSVTCVDIDEYKVAVMRSGISPIYEEGLQQLMQDSTHNLTYTTDYRSAYGDVDVIFIGVGTPEREDGSANLDYIYAVCDQIVESVTRDCVVVVKSTVPIGTNDDIEQYLRNNAPEGISIHVASNPEFLAQGTAVRDTIHASRIVVGTESDVAAEVMRQVYAPFTQEPYNTPYLSMNRRSAEMVKYASNDFLALKISYINEISNFCEKVDADIEQVTLGMSYDSRIGSKFLNSGIGYGGSCFPKDTKALHWLSREHDSELKTVKATIEVNAAQKIALFEKLKKDHTVKGMDVAVLGVTFKPGTDDMREAPSIDTVKLLLEYGAKVSVYDPVGMDNFKKIFGDQVTYSLSPEECLKDKDAVLIMTEWPEIKSLSLSTFKELLKMPSIYDGRNCYSIEEALKHEINYISMGRRQVLNFS
jgi:UDPglucose 6-dehydrogenase